MYHFQSQISDVRPPFAQWANSCVYGAGGAGYMVMERQPYCWAGLKMLRLYWPRMCLYYSFQWTVSMAVIAIWLWKASLRQHAHGDHDAWSKLVMEPGLYATTFDKPEHFNLPAYVPLSNLASLDPMTIIGCTNIGHCATLTSTSRVLRPVSIRPCCFGLRAGFGSRQSFSHYDVYSNHARAWPVSVQCMENTPRVWWTTRVVEVHWNI